MSWVKIDDQFTDHPKIVQAGPMAGWLFMCGLTYASRYLTDGFIPAAQVRRYADMGDTDALATRLVAVGLWEEAPDGYRIHDYLAYNPSAEQVRHERAQNAERIATWRAQRKGSGGGDPGNGVSNGVTPPVTNTVRNGPVTTSRTRTPSPNESTIPPTPQPDPAAPTEAPTAPERGSPPVDNFTPWFNAFWEAYPKRHGKKVHKADAARAARQVPNRDWDGVLQAARNYADSDGCRRGVAEDAHRFLRHWHDWDTPETPDPAVNRSNGHGAYRPNASERERDKLLDFVRHAAANAPARDGDDCDEDVPGRADAAARAGSPAGPGRRI